MTFLGRTVIDSANFMVMVLGGTASS